MTPATVTIMVGERTIQVSLGDAHSLGYFSNGAMDQFEKMYDGRGKLIHPEDQPFAEDLVNFGKAARFAWETAIEEK